MDVLLVGNPNVGKSSVFSRLTGVDVAISNYSGTTVEFKKGRMKLGSKVAEVIDVPGTYSLDPSCKAEEVAVDMVKDGDVIINVVDATNLERNLYLTLQLLEKDIPVVVALNFSDEARHKGIDIDAEKLSSLLKVPVIPTVAMTGEGIKKLVSSLSDARPHSFRQDDAERWKRIGSIIDKVQTIRPKDHTFLERLEDVSVRPLTGIPLAVLVLAFLFFLVRIIGEGMIKYITDPIFALYFPFLESFSSWVGPGIFHDILVGQLVDGHVHFTQSMGLLSTGLFVPLGMILPYVFAFYLALGVLEDSGYLPRLSALFDTLMHRLGLHGLAIIPMLLGLGCNVPGTLATRILNTKRQRFIAITMMAIAVPCMAQIAMVYGLLGKYGVRGLGTFFLILLVVWLLAGLVLNRFTKGIVPETFIEISPYRLPYWKALSKKLWMRLKSFFAEAIPYVFLGVILINILYVFGVIGFTSRVFSPVVQGLFGLPPEAAGSLIIGFLRKDVAVGMLVPLGLSMKQLIIASVILTMYFPCVATFVVIFKELGVTRTLKSVLIMLGSTLLVGTLLNIIL